MNPLPHEIDAVMDTDPMVLYEVNIRVLADTAQEYEEWLDKHIREIMQVEGFVSAEWFEIEEDSEAKELEEAVRNAVRLDESIPQEIREAAANPLRTCLYSVQYRLESKEAFDNYQRCHAEALRQEAIDKFGSRFAATRRVMCLREAYSVSPSI